MKLVKKVSVLINKTVNLFSKEEQILLFLAGIMLLFSIIFSFGIYSFGQYLAVILISYRIYFGWFWLSIIVVPLAFCASIYLIVFKTVFINKYASQKKELNYYINKFVKDMRITILVIVIFLLFGILIGVVLRTVNNRLVNQQVFDFEKNLFHSLPSVWLHSSLNPLKAVLDSLSPLILQAFMSLTYITGLVVALFLIVKQYQILVRLVVAFFLGLLVALPIWFMLPINSPNNFYIQEKSLEKNYHPNMTAVDFQKTIYEGQKKDKPTTTLPSLHVIWALIVVYYLGRYKKGLLFIAIPWFLLLFFGTFYFAQHYLIDGLLSLPLATLAIIISELFARRVLRWPQSAKNRIKLKAIQPGDS